MALTLNSNYQNVGFDYVLDGVRDLLISEFTYGKIYISPELKFNDPFPIKLWVSESATEDYNAISWSKEYTVDIDLYMIDSNHDENAYKQLYQDTERIYQVLFNNAHKEITVAGNSLQWLNGKTETIGINDFDGEEGEVDGLLKSSLSFTCNVHAGEISNYSTRSLDFDGSDDYVNLPHSELWQNISQISYDLWFKPDVVNVRQGLISSHAQVSGANNDAIEIEIQSNGTSFVGFRSANGTFYSATYGTSLSANTWYNLTGVLSSSDIKYYLNGQLVVTQSNWPGGNVANSASQTLMLARYATYYFNGKIGSFRAYNKALTAAEVLSNYNTVKPRFGL